MDNNDVLDAALELFFRSNLARKKASSRQRKKQSTIDLNGFAGARFHRLPKQQSPTESQ